MFANDTQAAKSRILDFLKTPALNVGIEDLPALWEMSLVHITCIRPQNLEDFPDFSTRLRGAFGQGIKTQPPLQDWRGRLSAEPHEVLFQPMGKADGQDEITKPIIIRGWVEGNLVHIEIRLFGFARTYANTAANAMLYVLEQGISMGGARPLRVSFRTLECTIMTPPPLTLPETLSSIAITFRSPVCVRHGASLTYDSRALLRAMPRRLAGLAPWMSVALLPDKTIDEDIACAHIKDTELYQHHWIRYSKNQQNRPIPMSGYLGKLVVSGKQLRRLGFYCRLAEHTNIGSHASLGLGWFDAALYP